MAKTIEELILEEIENGKRNKRLTEEILERIEQHTADYSAGYAYAEELGGIYAYSIRKWLEWEYRENGTLPETLDGLIIPPLRDMHARLSDVTARIQESFNQEDGIGLSAVKPPFNAEMAQHLSDKCVSVAKEKGIDEAGSFISEPIKTFALKTVDDTLKHNAEFQANAGIERKYRRICIGAKPCQWCRSLAGTYIYGQEPEEFFHRHQHCRCSIEPLHGRMRKRQKFKWEKKENDVILEARKAQGTQDNTFRKNHPINPVTKEVYIDHEMIITDKQKGKKIGEHARDYGLNPALKEDRDKMLQIIHDIVNNSDERAYGDWRGQDYPVLFHIKGKDVVIESNEGKFISILKGGITNARVKISTRGKV